MSDTDPRPVTPSTLFNCFSVTKAISAIALHQLVDQRIVDYTTLVKDVWPEFAANGKHACTIEHVLTHTAGLHTQPGSSASIEQLCDWEYMLKLIATAKPTDAPGVRAMYHYLSFGWLIGGIIRGATRGQHLQQFVRQRIAFPLGIENEMFMGFDKSDPAASLETHKSRIACIVNGFLDSNSGFDPQLLQRVMTAMQGGSGGAMVNGVVEDGVGGNEMSSEDALSAGSPSSSAFVDAMPTLSTQALGEFVCVDLC